MVLPALLVLVLVQGQDLVRGQGLVQGQGRGQAELLASVIEYSDFPEDSEILRRLEQGVPVNVIQRPQTGEGDMEH